MKKRRFAAGGDTSFSPAQLEWLGGADRTDPYILARMRRAVPDTPNRAPVEDRRPDWVRPEAKEPERAAPAAAEAPKRASRAAADEAPKARAPEASGSGSTVSTTAAGMRAYKPRRESTADSGADGRGQFDMSAYKPRRESAAAPSSAEDTPMSRIPGVVSDKGPTPSEGNSASGSEFGRNLSNTSNALAGFAGVRLAQAAAEGMTAGRAARAAAAAAKPAAKPAAAAAKPAAAAAKPAAKPASAAEKPTRNFSDIARGESAYARQARAADTGPKLPSATKTTATKTTAAKKAKLAGELRSAHNPTKFNSRSKKQDAKNTRFKEDEEGIEFKRGGAVKRYANGGSVSSRADGIAARGRTRGRMC